MNKTTRRTFVRRLSAALAAPAFVPSRVLGAEGVTPPNDKIQMAFIGVGGQGNGHIWGESWTYLPGGYISHEDVNVSAICDVRRDRREEVLDRINQYYATLYRKTSYKACGAYNDFREVLAREDIDAVLIASPIHWHTTMAVMAARAGKDVYSEKPTAVCIEESQTLVKTIKETGRVYQGGTQQRSEYEGRFRKAVELVRNGHIGDLQKVYAWRDGGGVVWPTEYGPEQPIPDTLDWDLWLGPAPMMPYQGRYDAHLFGFGNVNWGQHHYDIVQWGLDADRTGPVEIFMDEGHAAYRYANDVVVYGRPCPGETVGETGGVWFIGSEGRIGVDREHLVADPPAILEKADDPGPNRVYHCDSHSGNFLECVRSRKPTICDVETAHRAASVMLLGGVATRLNRTLKWDPVKEQFDNDPEATALLSLTKRKPWVI
ncbi:MAG: gfo/Idh/MocA family oxidoreductase [bacterium]|nr:gfo/Idh/MocA family oxidoreductase [bacterium]